MAVWIFLFIKGSIELIASAIASEKAIKLTMDKIVEYYNMDLNGKEKKREEGRCKIIHANNCSEWLE